MTDPHFAVRSWSATFDKRRGPVRCLEVWFDHHRSEMPHDVSIYVTQAGNVRVFVRKNGKTRRLK